MKKTIAALVGLVFGAALLPSAAVAAPAVKLLNPSPYTTNMIVSDKDDGADLTYHLVAWAREVPSNPIVEFQVQPVAGGNEISVDGLRVGTDTWEARLAIPSNFIDGQYEVRAILYQSPSEQLSADERIVTINRSDVPLPPAAESVEMVYPDNGGSLGFYTPATGRPNGLIDVTTSAGAERVRAFYTTSAPGAEPAWNACGFARVVERAATIRCTLSEGHSAAAVTAVAAVANNTPHPAEPSALADDSGDAHRVTSYAQRPTSVVVDPENAKPNPGTCPVFTARVSDQTGRPVAGVNVDVHVQNPNDQIRFGRITDVTDAFQAPDKAGHSNENAVECNQGPNFGENFGSQGEHNVPGGNDRKHIESSGGSDNGGSFTFSLKSDATGGSFVTAWADLNDDDAQSPSEPSGGSRVGWGVEPPAPQVELLMDPASATATQGSCERVVLAAKSTGSPVTGANVDLHIKGPDGSIGFCTPPDATTTRPPDQGGHTAGADPDGARHVEGETDASGQVIVGVTSATPGTMNLFAWIDATDDDTFINPETATSGTIEWAAPGERSISISRSAGAVEKGSRVRIFGQIDGDESCAAGQVVKLKARPATGGRFRTVGRTTTNDDGGYSFRPVVRRSTDYRTIAPGSATCNKARSRIITVKAR